MLTFGARVKQLRERRGWTQQELAKHATIPYMTIWRIERDEHKYTRMDVAVKLARAFGVSLDLLCGTYEDFKSERKPADAALVEA